MAKKPTAVQMAVLAKMAAGWQLARSEGFGNRITPREWLQKGGAGNGGESEQLRAGTIMRLTDRKLIAIDKSNYPRTTYKLTYSGKEAVSEAIKGSGDE